MQSPSSTRPWRKLHALTWAAVAVTLASIVALNWVWIEHDLPDGTDLYRGWPFYTEARLELGTFRKGISSAGVARGANALALIAIVVGVALYIEPFCRKPPPGSAWVRCGISECLYVITTLAVCLASYRAWCGDYFHPAAWLPVFGAYNGIVLAMGPAWGILIGVCGRLTG